MTPQWIALEGAVNTRAVVPGVLLRSDNLQSLTGPDVRALIDEQSLEVVLDLRTDVEVDLEGPGPLTREPAVRIEHRSLYPDSGGNTDLEAETINPWGRTPGDEWPEETPVVRAYMNYLRRRPDSIVGAIETIARAEGAALVHCAAGKDRTGVVVALALDAAGADRELVIDDYLATSERIEAIWHRLIASPTYRSELDGHDPQQHAPVRETIERVFELVEQQYGGSLTWLSDNGFGEQELELLRQRLAPVLQAS